MSLSHKPLTYGVRKPEIRKIAKGNPNLTEGEVERIINSILNELHARVNKDLMFWIARFVPKMTGALRRDLLMHVRETIVKNQVITFYIETSIIYAYRVNKYKTSQVRHKGKKITYKKREYTLWDPLAIGGFFDKMVLFAIKSILYNLTKIKRKFSARTKMKYKEMKIIKLW